MDHKSKIILIAGPTASGKSQIAIDLAKKVNGEIINADSMQVYKEFSIITSRPTKLDCKKIKHHLYGYISVKKNFSTGIWLKTCTKLIKKILRKKKTPILVGGTGLYFSALLNGLVTIPNIPIAFRNKIRKYHQQVGQKKFYKMLLKIDPNVKGFISYNDIQRSLRAYEVKKYTKKSLYEWIKSTKPNFNESLFKKFFLNTPRNILLPKINERVEKMFEQDVAQEVEEFLKLKLNKEMSGNKIIGIKEIKEYINGNMSKEQTKELIKIKTRQYAKRQFTWARGKMISWEFLNPKNYKEIYKKVIN